jgi:hypothetical protein
MFVFSEQDKMMRYYYNESTGRFTQTTSDSPMIDRDEPYILHKNGLVKTDYRVENGELVYDPLPPRTVAGRGN